MQGKADIGVVLGVTNDVLLAHSHDLWLSLCNRNKISDMKRLLAIGLSALVGGEGFNRLSSFVSAFIDFSEMETTYEERL